MIKRILYLWFILLQTSLFAQFNMNEVIISSNRSPVMQTIGDFDGDGKKDIAYATEGNTNINILYQEQNGSYTETKHYKSNSLSSIFGFDSGDLNKDGKSDLVFFENTLTTTDKVLIFISKGRSFDIFRLSVSSTTLTCWKLEIVDWDNDQNLDIMVLANADPVHFFKGNGNGQFARNTLSNFGSALNGEFSDINNDGKLDFIGAFEKKIIVYKSSGEVHIKQEFLSEENINEIEIGDISSDGLKDIIYVSFGSDNIYVLKNTGTTFQQEEIKAVSTMRGLDIEDYNNDGRQDILTSNFNNEKSVIVLKNTGYPSFTQETIINNYSSLLFDVSFSYINDDNKLDIVATSVANRIDIYHQNNSNQFELYFSKITGFMGRDGTVTDLNKDGYNDIITASLSNYAIAVQYGNQDLTFKDPIYFIATGPVISVTIIDYNLDNYPDIVFSCEGTQGGKPGIIKSDGLGGLQSIEFFSNLFGGRKLLSADFNGDGKLDIISGNVIMINNGNSLTQKVISVPNSSYEVAIADFNKDQRPDIIISDYQTIYYSINDGNGNFNTFIQVKNTGRNQGICAADINADGKLDIISTNWTANTISIYYQTNNGFTESVHQTSGFGALSVAVSDFNNDQKLDIAVGHQSSTLDVLLQTESGFQKNKFDLVEGISILVKDVNKDNKDDIVSFALNGNPIGILFNDFIEEPTNVASLPILSGLADNNVTISVTKGNGNGRLFTIAESTASASMPKDGMFYSFNESIGIGADLGNNNFAVYRGNNSSVNIKSLKPKTAYTIRIFEFNVNSKNTIINYASSGSAINFTTKETQTINYPEVPNKTIGDPPFTFSPSASSGLPVKIEIIQGNISITGNTITINDAGPVKLRLTQEGNSQFSIAETKTVEFCINPTKPSITTNSFNGGKWILTSSNQTNNQWLLNGALIEGAVNQNFEPQIAGQYSVRVYYSGCFNTSNPTGFIVVGLQNDVEDSQYIYPNPTKDYFILEVPQYIHVESLIIYQENGSEIFQPSHSQHHDNVHIDVKSLNPGSYYLKVSFQEGVTRFFRIIKSQ